MFDIAAVGLREHYDPLIRWLVRDGRCCVLLAIVDAEIVAYRAKGVPDGAWCMSIAEFVRMGCTPDVTVSFHPENGSELAAALARTGTRRVVMQHGLSDKAAFSEIEKSDPLADFDVVFLVGPVFREGSLEDYRRRHPATITRLQFREIGLPKTDALFNAEARRDQVLQDLGLDPSRPTVCYAPTWERAASLEQAGVDIIEALGQLPVNVIVKLHHASLCTEPYEWILRDGHGGKDWRRILAEITTRRPNVKLAPGQDAVPYLIASDLLVSDASGVAYEFVLLDRPVVFFDVPKLFAKYGTNGIHHWGRVCGDVVPDVDALKSAVAENLAQPTRKHAERINWITRITYSRGDATAKAGRAILELAAQTT